VAGAARHTLPSEIRRRERKGSPGVSRDLAVIALPSSTFVDG
jgi:hypothetical protein